MSFETIPLEIKIRDQQAEISRLMIRQAKLLLFVELVAEYQGYDWINRKAKELLSEIKIELTG